MLDKIVKVGGFVNTGLSVLNEIIKKLPNGVSKHEYFVMRGALESARDIIKEKEKEVEENAKYKALYEELLKERENEKT